MSIFTPAVATIILVFVGLFGLAIGSFLNVVVHRVPAGLSLAPDSRCPSCGARIRAWQNIPVASWIALRGACASCGGRISARYPLVELATALAFVVVAWIGVDAWLGADGLAGSASIAGLPAAAGVTVVLAYLYLAAVSIALVLIDVDVRRLPNAIVLPSAGVLLVLFSVATLLGAPWEGLARALVGGAVLFSFYAALRLLRRGAMGGGDVKLAAVLGLALGWIGWGALVVGGFAAFVLGGLYGVALLATGRAARSSAIPFGPWMIAGAWVGIFAGEDVARWYIGMLSLG